MSGNISDSGSESDSTNEYPGKVTHGIVESDSIQLWIYRLIQWKFQPLSFMTKIQFLTHLPGFFTRPQSYDLASQQLCPARLTKHKPAAKPHLRDPRQAGSVRYDGDLPQPTSSRRP